MLCISPTPNDAANRNMQPREYLKPGGWVVMIDFKKTQTPVGSPMELRIDRADLLKRWKRTDSN